MTHLQALQLLLLSGQQGVNDWAQLFEQMWARHTNAKDTKKMEMEMETEGNNTSIAQKCVFMHEVAWS